MAEKILERPDKKQAPFGLSKKIAFIIAFRDFRDEEYFITEQVLKNAGAVITTASSDTGKAVGMFGGEANASLLIEDLNISDYDALVFIGGSGAVKYINDEKCHQLAQKIIEENKVLGAICIAPAILAEAGTLEGKKATVWSSSMDKSVVKILKENGAIYKDEAVVIDGKIVTANGPIAAKQFAQAIIEKLK